MERMDKAPRFVRVEKALVMIVIVYLESIHP